LRQGRRAVQPGAVDRGANAAVLEEAARRIEHAREVAEQTALAKAEFMANISHELRTPLQSIIGFAELGARRAREQPVMGEMFRDIGAAGHRMLRLVNDLLDLARADSAELPMNFEFGDLRPLLREVVAELRPQIEARGVSVHSQTGTQPLTLSVDALRIQQVVRNVLANAVRFSPPDGVVDLDAGLRADGSVVIEVADRGPGIPAEELERIFDAFVQSSRTRDGSGGTGLGLAISRRIVAAHGGAIVALPREGGGSVFRITLPGMVWGRPAVEPAADGAAGAVAAEVADGVADGDAVDVPLDAV
jgi:signal transduction histidine kinase